MDDHQNDALNGARREPVWTDRAVELRGRGRIWIREGRGPAGAPTVMLLHGLAATGRLNWFTALPALVERFNVVVVDHRGHGQGIRTSTFRLVDCADDAMALQDASAKAAGQVNAASGGLPQVSNLFFIARIELDNPELEIGGGRLALEPGMTVRAEIETETRRIIDYVLSPVTAVLDEAGHER